MINNEIDIEQAINNFYIKKRRKKLIYQILISIYLCMLIGIFIVLILLYMF